MAKRKLRKKHKDLTPEQKKMFAQELLNGRMFKQLVAEYGIASSSGYNILNDLLEYRLEWKKKEILNA